MKIQRKNGLRTLAVLLAGFLMMAAGCDLNNPPPNTGIFWGIAIAKGG
jgi:hypothetical protein